jgi:hypothetical protein
VVLYFHDEADRRVTNCKLYHGKSGARKSSRLITAFPTALFVFSLRSYKQIAAYTTSVVMNPGSPVKSHLGRQKSDSVVSRLRAVRLERPMFTGYPWLATHCGPVTLYHINYVSAPPFCFTRSPLYTARCTPTVSIRHPALLVPHSGTSRIFLSTHYKSRRHCR